MYENVTHYCLNCDTLSFCKWVEWLQSSIVSPSLTEHSCTCYVTLLSSHYVINGSKSCYMWHTLCSPWVFIRCVITHLLQGAMRFFVFVAKSCSCLAPLHVSNRHENCLGHPFWVCVCLGIVCWKLSKLDHRYIRNDMRPHVHGFSSWLHKGMGSYTNWHLVFSAVFFCLPLSIQPCYKLPKSSITWNPWSYIKNWASLCIFFNTLRTGDANLRF
jgi:hypothetical protein